ncbi:4Fe-4S dicluster domain-containing protein [Candidatus Altiarchaeota archaeon]
MDEVTKKLRDEAKKLLKDGKADWIIGFREGSNPLRTTPVFINNPKDVDKLVFNRFCTHNLANYLSKMDGKVGVVVKGCDSRSVIELLKNHQVKRENLYLMGVGCPGMFSEKKILKECASREKVSLKDEFLQDCCLECEHRKPVVYDVLFESKEKDIKGYVEKRHGIKDPRQRREFWLEQFRKCIKCNACKEACPNCFCTACVLTEQPDWMSKPRSEEDLWMYQLIRIYHNAGRCTDCGACERVCPMNIPIRQLLKKILEDAKELFGYESGLSLDEEDPLTTFNKEGDESAL